MSNYLNKYQHSFADLRIDQAKAQNLDLQIAIQMNITLIYKLIASINERLDSIEALLREAE